MTATTTWACTTWPCTPPTRRGVDEAYAYAGQAGMALLDAPAPRDYGPEYYSCYFRDPDGIKVEVATMRAP